MWACLWDTFQSQSAWLPWRLGSLQPCPVLCSVSSVWCFCVIISAGCACYSVMWLTNVCWLMLVIRLQSQDGLCFYAIPVVIGLGQLIWYCWKGHFACAPLRIMVISKNMYTVVISNEIWQVRAVISNEIWRVQAGNAWRAALIAVLSDNNCHILVWLVVDIYLAMCVPTFLWSAKSSLGHWTWFHCLQ